MPPETYGSYAGLGAELFSLRKRSCAEPARTPKQGFLREAAVMWRQTITQAEKHLRPRLFCIFQLIVRSLLICFTHMNTLYFLGAMSSSKLPLSV